MFFKNIKLIKSKSEKKFLIENIKNFIKIISIKNSKKICSKQIEISDEIIKEIVNIGLIQEKHELIELKKLLKTELFENFISSIYLLIKNPEFKDNNIEKFYNTYRKLKQHSMKGEKRHNIVDFFCGAGGFSLGFIQENFKVILANDIEEVAIETYKFNHPEISTEKIIHGDIKEIVDNLENYIEDEVDIVIGGPPCQGFSSANQQRIIDDPRNELYKYFIKGIEKIKPKMVVMENVRGMLKVADQVIEDYKNIKFKLDQKEIGYEIKYKLLNANDFGVAQNRERLIYIGIREDLLEKQNINIDTIFDEIDINKISHKFVLKDALDYIQQLEAPKEKNKTEEDCQFSGEKIRKNEFIGNENNYLKLINLNRQIPIIFNHKARYCNEINYEIYRLLNEGEDATNEKISHIMPYSHRNHLFKDKYFKLINLKPSRTITAHLKMDCHSHIHPTQVRSITPREAARIQSFPDDYFFLGAYLKTYMQIGNAVPPLLSRTIAKVLKKYL